MGNPTTQVTVMCVDDEPAVLEGLALHLRRRYQVVTHGGGAEALAAIEQTKAPAVVISDMRMPGMDGASFLAKLRVAAPDTVRLLLTGQADIESAIAAINEGQIFRFLLKPCPPTALLGAVASAVEQYRLVTAERVLLEQTLHGSIQTLADVLSITNPLAFGRATRIRKHVAALAARLDVQERWQVEVAATLCQLGCVALPPEVAEKVYFGRHLTEKEQAMVDRVPAVTEQLLGHIPRLEAVAAILQRRTRSASKPAEDPASRLVQTSAEILRVATEFDALESSGIPGPLAVSKMSAEAGRYDPLVLEALAEIGGTQLAATNLVKVRTCDLAVGMVLAEDVSLESGSLLVARGYEVTPGFLARIRNFRPGTLKEQMVVCVPREESPESKARAS